MRARPFPTALIQSSLGKRLEIFKVLPSWIIERNSVCLLESTIVLYQQLFIFAWNWLEFVYILGQCWSDRLLESTRVRSQNIFLCPFGIFSQLAWDVGTKSEVCLKKLFLASLEIKWKAFPNMLQSKKSLVLDSPTGSCLFWSFAFAGMSRPRLFSILWI